VIDISAFSETRAHPGRIALLQTWREALECWGFAVITGHGFPEDALRDLRASAERFFMEGDKEGACLKAGYGVGGYCSRGIESVSRSVGQASPPDLVESVCFHNPEDSARYGAHGAAWEAATGTLQPAAHRYYHEATQLVRLLVLLTSEALGCSEGNSFVRAHENLSCSLRLAYYGPVEAELIEDGQLRYGAHTDYTGFTILSQDMTDCAEAGGLQVMSPSGEWVAVSAVAGSFVINAGDLISRMTNDCLRSNLHRVTNPRGSFCRNARLSVAFFTGPADEVVCETLPLEGDAKYKPITAGEHLQAKLRATNV